MVAIKKFKYLKSHNTKGPATPNGIVLIRPLLLFNFCIKTFNYLELGGYVYTKINTHVMLLHIFQRGYFSL